MLLGMQHGTTIAQGQVHGGFDGRAVATLWECRSANFPCGSIFGRQLLPASNMK